MYKLIQILKKSYALIKSSKVHSIFFLFLTIGLMMGAMNSAVASDLNMVDALKTYDLDEETKMLYCDTGVDNCLVAKTATTSQVLNFYSYAAGTDGFIAYGDVDPDSIPYAQRKGLLGISEDAMVAMLQNQPTQNVYAHLAKEWVPGYEDSVNSVYAQDGGYEYLISTGLDSIWEKTRNLAYIIFVIVLVIAGFMIMFRHKIGGQMAVTVFNTIPQLIVGMILVTFSFAIVGLIMNLGSILSSVVIGVLNLGSDTIIPTHMMSIFGTVFSGQGWFRLTTFTGIGGSAGLIFLALTAFAGGGPVGLAAGAVLVGTLVVLVSLVIIGVVVMASLKVFFTLVKAYVGIVIDLILGPIYLAFSVIPGQQKLRDEWLKRVVKNTLVFPVVLLFVNIGIFLLKQNAQLSFPETLVTGGLNAEASGSQGLASALSGVLTLYLWFVAAQVPKILDDLIPTQGGKGTAEAFKTAASSIPVIKGLAG